jgi:histidine ammonia-lyase
VIVIDGARLTAADITALAERRADFSLAAAARDRVAASARFAATVASSRPVYGRTTGVGANRTVALGDPDAQALGLLRSHAGSAGPLRSRERVRAMLAVRLNQLAAGGSGVSPAMVDALAAMLAADALPPVRELGSVGTADLPALAVTGLALAGLVETDPPLPARVGIGIGDALAFISSNAGALGDAALAVTRLRALATAALPVAALTHAAVNGNPEAYARVVERTTPFPGARTVCSTLRGYLAGATGTEPARIQDPFGLRALPQVHGALLDRLTELDAVVTALANAPSENPVLLPEPDGGTPGSGSGGPPSSKGMGAGEVAAGGVAHHAAFHAAYLAQALDAARSALAQAAGLGLNRLTMFAEPALTGLAPFLAAGPAGASGTMIVEYVAASALAALRAAAAPSAVHTVVLSRGVEEDASFAATGASAALDSIGAYRTVIACELVVALRCLRMRATALPDGLADVVARCGALPGEVADRDLTGDIAAAETLLDQLA